jgi:hypothetical protein
MAASSQLPSSALNFGAIIAVALYVGAGVLFLGQTSQAVEQLKLAPRKILSTGNQQLIPPPVQVAKLGWVLHGRVFDAQDQPMANFTITLVDGKRRFLDQYGSAHTDNTGYFLLSYEGGAGQPPTVTRLFLEVVNTDGAPVYLSAMPFQPQFGTASYQTIILPVRGLGHPPSPLR